jgi:hypothetical protein
VQKVHVYSIDRARNTGHIEATNPTRMYIRGREGDEDFHAPIFAQQVGNFTRFYDQSSENELPRESIPEYILEDLIRDPLRLIGQTPEQVMKFCPHCPEHENAIGSGEWEPHLLRHLANLEAQVKSREGVSEAVPVSTSPAPAAPSGAPPKRGRGRPRKHPLT